MALTSVFYDGPVTETDRARNRAGAPDYGVYGADDFKVSAHPSIPYALIVKAGRAHGWGVTDTATTDQTVQCDTLSGSGAVRFDLITVNRNWQPLLGGPSTLKAISGGSTMPDMNTIRKIGPGVEDDQPIALVEWRGGVNTPYRITDLRCWAGNGGVVAVDLLALNYLARPGANVLIGSTTWRFTQGANNVWGWTDSGSSVLTYGFVQPAGWSLSGECRVSKAGALLRVEVDVTVKRTGANIGITTDFSDIGAVLANAVRGDSGDVKYLPIAVSGGTGNNGTIAMAYVNTATGKIGFRSAIGTTFSWTSGAVATLNFRYFI